MERRLFDIHRYKIACKEKEERSSVVIIDRARVVEPFIRNIRTQLCLRLPEILRRPGHDISKQLHLYPSRVLQRESKLFMLAATPLPLQRGETYRVSYLDIEEDNRIIGMPELL